MRTGRRATDAQVKTLRLNLNLGASLHMAAMKAGMDRKTARKYRDLGQLPSEVGTPHTWRTRTDPLVNVWPALEELLQREPTLQAKTLVEWLQRHHSGQDWQRQRRTVERRVRQWKAEHGPAKEIFFTQVHEPGRLGSSDFSHMDKLGITIQGQPFPHMIYHFVLTYSNWEHATLCFTESFASLSAGTQNALWELGGVPERHRTDRMTLAVHQDGNAEQYTARYQALMRYYGMTPEATNAYSGHENGDCEQGHRRFKEALEQELLLRGSRDFASREEYWQFVCALLARRNASRAQRFAEEQARLHSLPKRRLETLERERVRVGQGSTIRVKKNVYSVPARLRGERVEARIGAELIEVWYAGSLVQTMERLRGVSKHRINYRHVIDWLVRKPGAFARYVYREDLYPTVTFRRAYDALQQQRPGSADRDYLRLLQMAAQDGESRVEEALTKLLDQGQPVSVQAVQTLLGKDTPLSVAAQVSVPEVDLRCYDALLEGDWVALPAQDLSVMVSDLVMADGPCAQGMSQENQNKEVTNEQGCNGSIDALSAGTTVGDGAQSVRGSRASGDSRDVELCRLFTGISGARVPAATTESDRAVVEGIAAAPGEDVGGPGLEAVADEGNTAVAWSAERGLFGPARECTGIWSSGFGEDARCQCRVVGVGAGRPAAAVHEVQSAGARTVESETRPGAEGIPARVVALGGTGDRRPGLRATEPGGDGGLVHVVGGTVRAGQCAGDEQPGLLEMGADLQRPDDDGGGDRPAGASQRDFGTEPAELPSGAGEEVQGRRRAKGWSRGRREIE